MEEMTLQKRGEICNGLAVIPIALGVDGWPGDVVYNNFFKWGFSLGSHLWSPTASGDERVGRPELLALWDCVWIRAGLVTGCSFLVLF